MKRFLIKALLVLTVLSIVPSAAITVSASDTSDLDIFACNLSFENEVHILYAIKSDNKNVRLLVWSTPQNSYTLGTEESVVEPLNQKREIDGYICTVFKYKELVAKQMTDDVYVRAYDSDSGEYGQVHKYSILQYAYNKLGKTGTATTDEKLKIALQRMLEYGAAMQEYFDYNTDRLATDEYYQIEINGGALEDGFSKGLYKKGSEIAISAPSSNQYGWRFSHLKDTSGKMLFLNGDKIKVGDINEVYTSVYRSIVASGSCGSNAHWSLDSNNLLIINGTGDMTEISEFASNTTPWYSYRDKIKRVVVCEGITSIGSCAFNYCSALESVSLPSTITKLGIRPFLKCTSLKSIAIPDNVTTIGPDAFYSCTALENVYFTANSKLTTIGDYAFDSCTSIKTFYIPEGVAEWNLTAFRGMTSLETVYIPKSVTKINSLLYVSSNIKEIHYAGTQSEWKKISKNSGWDSCITSYTVIYSSQSPNS